jgi:hypothetical protein
MSLLALCVASIIFIITFYNLVLYPKLVKLKKYIVSLFNGTEEIKIEKGQFKFLERRKASPFKEMPKKIDFTNEYYTPYTCYNYRNIKEDQSKLVNNLFTPTPHRQFEKKITLNKKFEISPYKNPIHENNYLPSYIKSNLNQQNNFVHDKLSLRNNSYDCGLTNRSQIKLSNLNNKINSTLVGDTNKVSLINKFSNRNDIKPAYKSKYQVDISDIKSKPIDNSNRKLFNFSKANI